MSDAAAPTGPVPFAPVLTPAQWAILAAIADTVVPALTASESTTSSVADTPSADPNAALVQHAVPRPELDAAAGRIASVADRDVHDPIVAAFIAERATASPRFREGVERLIGSYLDGDSRKKLVGLLDALNNRALAWLLTGYAKPMTTLPVNVRERILLGWQTSRFAALRDAHASLTGIAKLYWLRTSPTLGEVLGYPRLPVGLSPPDSHPEFEFLQFSQRDDPEVLRADVVIVGSGCGGAVAAKTLAEAGLRVIVVDKSHHYSPPQLPLSESDAANEIFDNGGMFYSDDGKTLIIAGSTWGGGGSINWSASLQTQGYVRREWSGKFGLRHFTSAQFQADLDAVCDRMGVGTAAIKHNAGNAALLEGARRLGWAARAVPQNTAGHVHADGYCTLGCRSNEKQGPAVTFLPDAARAGAKFIEGLEVTDILWEEGTLSGDKVARGVHGMWTSRDESGGVTGAGRTQRRVVIHAPKVIISAGTLRTPVLLQRAGLKNRNIGRNLHLHPVVLIGAKWDEAAKPWEGAILTSVVNEFEDIDGDGYGAKLEACTVLPGWFLSCFAWDGGLKWKEFASSLRASTGYIALARDRHGGRVYPDPSDPSRVRIAYSPHASDRAHILAGAAGLAQLLYVAGAREIHTMIPNVPPYVRRVAPGDDAALPEGRRPPADNPSLDDADFQLWLAGLRRAGLGSDASFASAHQMGSCRMGVSPSNSAVDPRGAVWGAKGLYVADASVFPSASGVNPMITNMAISRGIARGIAEECGVPATERARL